MIKLKIEGKRKGDGTVNLRYSYSRKGRKYFGTGIVIPLEDFDNTNLEKPVKKTNRNSTHYNRIATEIVHRICKIHSDQVLNKIDPTADLVFQLFHTNREINLGNTHDPLISSLYEEFFAAEGYDAATTRIYRIVFDQFDDCFKRIRVSEFDIYKWNAYRDHLRKKRKQGANTICIRLTKLKHFIKHLQERGFELPITNFPMPKEEIKMACLDSKEIRMLEDYTPETNRLCNVKDVGLFQTYTGLRISDVKRVNETHIKEESNGNYCLKMEALKTGKKLFIPLREEALNILRKHNYRLPVYAEAHYNREIKKLLKAAGIDRIHEWLVYDEKGSKVYEQRRLYEIFANHCFTRSAITYFLQHFSPDQVARIVGKSHGTIMKYYYAQATESDIVNKATLSNFWVHSPSVLP